MQQQQQQQTVLQLPTEVALTAAHTPLPLYSYTFSSFACSTDENHTPLFKTDMGANKHVREKHDWGLTSASVRLPAALCDCSSAMRSRSLLSSSSPSTKPS
jgi:hypothetical protein